MLLVALSRKKEYMDHKVRDMDFKFGEQVLLKVLLWRKSWGSTRGVVLTQYISPFEVFKEVDPIAYQLDLPPRLSGVHLVFSVLMLKRYYGDRDYIIKWLYFLDKDLSYEKGLVAILHWDVWILRKKEICLVKVQQKHRLVEEATWKIKKDCRTSTLYYLRIQVFFSFLFLPIFQHLII